MVNNGPEINHGSSPILFIEHYYMFAELFEFVLLRVVPDKKLKLLVVVKSRRKSCEFNKLLYNIRVNIELWVNHDQDPKLKEE